MFFDDDSFLLSLMQRASNKTRLESVRATLIFNPAPHNACGDWLFVRFCLVSQAISVLDHNVRAWSSLFEKEFPRNT
jgi:hypothetical protein